MSRSHLRLALASTVVGVALVLVGCSASPAAPSASASKPTATATPTPPPVSSATLDAEHVVTQEGLAIALASNVLQTQLQLVAGSSDLPSTSCRRLSHGGSTRVTGITHSSGSSKTFVNDIYYDSSCHQRYIVQRGTVRSVGDFGAAAQAVATYLGVSGSTLGTLTTSATASLSNGLQLEGTGTFAIVGGASVSLGLACQPGSSDSHLKCQGGIAQNFPGLGHSIASITPLVLALGTHTSSVLTFAGTANSSAIASVGALSIASPDHKHLAISGGSPVAGTPVTKGEAGGFVLFPATPTGWTVTDAATGVMFRIAVTDNAERSLTGSVTRLSDSKQIAALAVDKSGTGTITYLGEAPAPIVSWLLTK